MTGTVLWRAARGAGALVLAAAFGARCAGAAETPLDPPLFEYQGRAYTAADAGPKLGKLLYELQQRHYAEHVAVVDEMLFEIHLDAEVARSGEARQAVAERLLAVPEPTEEEIARFYAENSERIDRPLAEVGPRIARHLRGERIAERKAALVARLKAEGSFALAREPVPVPPAAFDLSGFPVLGRADAPITVVEFGDYQCPHCQRALPLLKRVVERYPDDVRLIFLDFPINRSGVSRRVAEGAVCADEQGAYWPFHELAFARQDRLDDGSARAIAAALELDLEAFSRCLASPVPRERVRRAERQARALGITGTPAIYVNGRPLRSADLAGDLAARIEALRGG